MKTRVLIADDHPIVRSGIRTELSRHADFEIVGEAVTADEVIDMVGRLPVDAIILDISMPGLKATDVINQLGMSHPGIKILVLTAHGEKGTIMAILKAGAHGYILKDEDPYAIPDAIRTVMRGKNWVSPAVTTLMMGRIRENKINPSPGMLTEMESEVLRLVADGLTTKDITGHLGMAVRTVEFHITNIYDKLGVTSRASAVRWAKEHGIL